jgi:RibD C-terminal domain
LVDNWDETTILRSLDDVAALKETEGGPIIIHGSATLARTLSDTGLNDRYRLLVFPVLLGAGKGMFTDRQGESSIGVGRERTYANDIQNLVCDVVNQLAARLGRLYELTKLASAAVKAEALGYSPKVIERSLLVHSNTSRYQSDVAVPRPTSSSVTAVLTNSYRGL